MSGWASSVWLSSAVLPHNCTCVVWYRWHSFLGWAEFVLSVGFLVLFAVDFYERVADRIRFTASLLFGWVCFVCWILVLFAMDFYERVAGRIRFTASLLFGQSLFCLLDSGTAWCRFLRACGRPYPIDCISPFMGNDMSQVFYLLFLCGKFLSRGWTEFA